MGRKKIFSNEFFLSSSLKKSNRAAVTLSRSDEIGSARAREREERRSRRSATHHRRHILQKKERKRSAQSDEGESKGERKERERSAPPAPSTSILIVPLGPRLVFITSCKPFAALMFMNNAAALSMDSAFGFTERREEVIFFLFFFFSRERESCRAFVGCKTFGDFHSRCVSNKRSFDFFPALSLSRARRLVMIRFTFLQSLYNTTTSATTNINALKYATVIASSSSTTL